MQKRIRAGGRRRRRGLRRQRSQTDEQALKAKILSCKRVRAHICPLFRPKPRSCLSQRALDTFPISILTTILAIDYLNALLAERASLSSRLDHARAVLTPGHPALSCAPALLDDKGTPLWEREWTGGSGWGDAEDDGADDD
jgi:hypothetical protein